MVLYYILVYSQLQVCNPRVLLLTPDPSSSSPVFRRRWLASPILALVQVATAAAARPPNNVEAARSRPPTETVAVGRALPPKDVTLYECWDEIAIVRRRPRYRLIYEFVFSAARPDRFPPAESRINSMCVRDHFSRRWRPFSVGRSVGRSFSFSPSFFLPLYSYSRPTDRPTARGSIQSSFSDPELGVCQKVDNGSPREKRKGARDRKKWEAFPS